MKKINLLFFILATLMTALFTACEKTPEEQAEYDEKKIVEYLQENEIEAIRHESGLYYRIDELGSGSNPGSSSTVTVNYVGFFMDGKVFDINGSSTFSLNGVIKAWQIGVPLIKRGGKIKLFSPSGLAYGNRARQGIPANSILLFDIELIDFY